MKPISFPILQIYYIKCLVKIESFCIVISIGQWAYLHWLLVSQKHKTVGHLGKWPTFFFSNCTLNHISSSDSEFTVHPSSFAWSSSKRRSWASSKEGEKKWFFRFCNLFRRMFWGICK